MANGPNIIDVHVGNRVSRVRVFRSISLNDLARAIGLTAADLKSREAGLVRFRASELMNISERLQVELSFFFDGAPQRADRPSNVPKLQIVVSNDKPVAAERSQGAYSDKFHPTLKAIAAD